MGKTWSKEWGTRQGRAGQDEEEKFTLENTIQKNTLSTNTHYLWGKPDLESGAGKGWTG